VQLFIKQPAMMSLGKTNDKLNEILLEQGYKSK